MEAERQVLSILADLLTYPRPGLAERAREGAEMASSLSPQAAGKLEEFAEFFEGAPLGTVEEIYTRTFDLNPVCYPYLGFHVVGEGYRRGAFMVKLKEIYREHGFPLGEEDLPDYLPTMLRFLSVVEDEPTWSYLREECLLPALQKMEASFRGKENPYGKVIGAALDLLEKKENQEEAKGGVKPFA